MTQGSRRALGLGVLLALLAGTPRPIPGAGLSAQALLPQNRLPAAMANRTAAIPPASPREWRPLESGAQALRIALQRRLGAAAREHGWIGSLSTSGWALGPD